MSTKVYYDDCRYKVARVSVYEEVLVRDIYLVVSKSSTAVSVIGVRVSTQ